MKTLQSLTLSIFISLTLLFGISSTALAQSQGCDSVVVGDSCVLRSGQTIQGDMTIFGGNVNLESGSSVNGDVILIGGSLDVFGSIHGDLVATGGFVHLNNGSEVNGDITRIGGNLLMEDGAVVQGDMITSNNPGFSMPKNLFNRTRVSEIFRPVGSFFLTIFQALAFAVIAIIVALVIPKNTVRLAQTSAARFGLSLGIGFLGALVVLFGSLILTVTLIGIPLALLVLLAFFIALPFGWIGLGLEMGNRVAKLFKTTLSTPIATGIGTLLLTLAASAIGWVPCIGFLAVLLVLMVAFGSVVLTRFGIRLPAGMPEIAAQSIASSTATAAKPVAVESSDEATHNVQGKAGKTQIVDETAIKKMIKDKTKADSQPPKPQEPLPPAE